MHIQISCKMLVLHYLSEVIASVFVTVLGHYIFVTVLCQACPMASAWLSLFPLNSSCSKLSREESLSPCPGMLHVASRKLFQAHVYILSMLVIPFRGVGGHSA